jgi:hypothetical protein
MPRTQAVFTSNPLRIELHQRSAAKIQRRRRANTNVSPVKELNWKLRQN